jgi:tripartite-type tricarboxylate transporter receptor subunit TctC
MKQKRAVRSCCLAATLVAVFLPAKFAAAQDAVADFFKGKQVNIVVGSSAGGGYDTYARLLSRYMGNHIPGNPTVVVQNMPGAASNKAAGYVYSVAPKDGTYIAALYPPVILQPLLESAVGGLDPSKLVFLGSANSDTYICIVRSDAPATTLKDATTKEVILGASAEGGTTRDLPAMLNNLLGTKFRIVTGYAGSKEITLSLERNEVHGTCGIGWTGLPTLHPDWFAKDMIRVMAQLSVKGHPDLNQKGVPRAYDLAKTDEDRQVMELVFSQGTYGRPYVLPPDTPPDRVAALRKGFVEALQDKALLADAQKMALDLDPMPGDDLQALIAKLYALPPNIVQRARQALIYKPPT